MEKYGLSAHATAEDGALADELRRENPKGKLLEFCMQRGSKRPSFELSTDGPDHQPVCALIAAGSLERMQLVVEDSAWVVFDTSAVVLSLASNGAFPQEANS